MPRLSLALRRVCVLALLMLGLSALPAHAVLIGKASISGQVVDSEGLPLAGVRVRVQGPLPLIFPRQVETGAGGFYRIDGVSPEQKLQLSFSKSGYALGHGSVSLQRQKPLQFDKLLLVRMQPRTLNKMLAKAGAVQTLIPQTGGTLQEQGFKVHFPPNSLTVSGSQPVDLVISPIDVSTEEVQAAPGDFSARTLAGQNVLLESFSMADFSLSQNGRKVNLKAGSQAQIELLLPRSTPLSLGDQTPMWHFDTVRGLWIEEGVGQVAASTVLPDRLAVFASVAHFSWWNSDQPIATTEVSGRVVDGNGQALAGASILSSGIDYAGTSAAQSDAQGNFCIKVKSSALSSLRASLFVDSLSASSPALAVQSGAAGQSCAAGSAVAAGDLVISTGVACIQGDVRDEQGAPVVGLEVTSSAGSTAVTAADGSFQLKAPENASVKVRALGYPTQLVNTQAAGDACASVALRKPSGGGGTTCVSGMVYQCSPSNPVVEVSMVAWRNSDETLFGMSAPSDADGRYCIDGLPANELLEIKPNHGYSMDSQEIDSGAGGGTCAAQNCTVAPPQDIWCY